MIIAKLITAEQIRIEPIRSYNPQEWDKKIDRMLKFKDTLFYHVPKGGNYDYDRYFVEYTIPEGIRLFAICDYTSTLSNGAFFSIVKQHVSVDGETFQDVLNRIEDGDQAESDTDLKKLSKKIQTSNLFKIEVYTDFKLNNTVLARKFMIRNSKAFNTTYTKEIF